MSFKPPIPKLEISSLYKFIKTFSIVKFSNPAAAQEGYIDGTSCIGSQTLETSEINELNSCFIPIDYYHNYYDGDKYHLVYICLHLDSGLYFRLASSSTLYLYFDNSIQKVE